MKTWKQVLSQRVRGGNSSRTKGKSNSTYPKQKLSGPAMKKSFIDMAEDVFNIYDTSDDCDHDVEEGDEYGSYKVPRVSGEYLEPQQLSLQLFSVEEQQQHLDMLINKYELALERMGEYALKWKALEQTAEHNQQFAKMFRDLKMMQKLVGKNVI